jgi:hypothetical protein
MINELIEMKKFSTAQKACDENEDFYNAKAEEMRDLWREATVAQMGLELNDDDHYLAKLSVSKPRRRA